MNIRSSKHLDPVHIHIRNLLLVGFPTTMDERCWHANPGHDDEDDDDIHDHDIVGYPVLSNCIFGYLRLSPSPARRKNRIECSI